MGDGEGEGEEGMEKAKQTGRRGGGGNGKKDLHAWGTHNNFR